MHLLSPVRAALLAGLVCAGMAAVSPASGATSTAVEASSVNRAGYTVAADSVTKVRASWVQPAARCGHGASFANFEAALSRGRRPVAVGTAADCHAGKASYYAWVKFGGSRQRLDGHVAPGDVVRVSLSADQTGLGFSVVDVTQRWGEGGASGGGGGRFTRATVGVVARTAKSGVLPLTDFGTARFHGVKVDKQPFGGQQPTKLVMRSKDGQVMAVPGAVRKDLAYPVVWKHA